MVWVPESIAYVLSRLLDGHRDHLSQRITHMEHRIMAAIDDLKQAIADLATALTDNTNEIEVLLQKIATSQAGTPDADIQSAVSQIRGLIAQNKTEVDKAKAVG